MRESRQKAVPEQERIFAFTGQKSMLAACGKLISSESRIDYRMRNYGFYSLS